MSILMTEPEIVPAEPATERRGGRYPDWGAAKPGEELPEPDPEYSDPLPGDEDCDMGYRADRGLPRLGRWCGIRGCGGD
jgi:hypothetical protein